MFIINDTSVLLLGWQLKNNLKIDDAKNLYDWITNQWKNKQSVVKIKTFANPLISVGDVISVNYPFNGFDGTQKFVITNVTQSWGEGLSTELTARSIYSS